MSNLHVRPARPDDVAAIFGMIQELAVFEKLEHLVVANEAMLQEALFCDKPVAEAIVGETGGEVVTYALFFHNFSTFLTKRGLILRRVSAYRLPHCLRLTVGTEEANRLVIAALVDFLGKKA